MRPWSRELLSRRTDNDRIRGKGNDLEPHVRLLRSGADVLRVLASVHVAAGLVLRGVSGSGGDDRGHAVRPVLRHCVRDETDLRSAGHGPEPEDPDDRRVLAGLYRQCSLRLDLLDPSVHPHARYPRRAVQSGRQPAADGRKLQPSEREDGQRPRRLRRRGRVRHRAGPEHRYRAARMGKCELGRRRRI